ncbi:MAG TPA: prepilin-type N-terminal cleavage/methylation domain-containing protein [Pirellulales bacterium]|jgi:hypothetical protein
MNRRLRITVQVSQQHALSKRRMPSNRRATSLIEMLIVITLMTVVMAIMGMLLNGAWRVQRAIEQHRLTLDTLQRLSTQFRTDVHSAASAAIRIGALSGDVAPESLSSDASIAVTEEASVSSETNNPAAPQLGDQSSRQTFTLLFPDHKQIDYQVAVGTVIRIVRDGEQVVARESYALPTDAVVKWEITSSDFNRRQSGWQASLLISYPRSTQMPEFAARREVRVDATSGLQTRDIHLHQNQP